jgi:hypothetical protein
VEEVNSEAVGMLTDLYRDFAKSLTPEVAHISHSADNVSLRDLPRQLLETIHSLALQMWPASKAEKARVAVIKAYEERRGKMLKIIKPTTQG